MITRITSKFGEISAIRDYRPHTGIDIALNENTPLRTISEGIVDKVFDGSGAIGKGLSVRLQDGSRIIYGHLNDVSVKVGEKVHVGELIGLSGNTGHSTAPHLHFAMKSPDGTFIDPTSVIDKVAQYTGDMVLQKQGILVHLGEWLHETISTKITEISVNHAVNWIEDIVIAFPILAIVSFGVYALVNMVSKTGAKWSAIATFIYGILVVS